jgi:uridylate kinase
MGKKLIVLSLGGSLIIPENIDLDYLRKFRETIFRNTDKYKFVIVCGGGSTARKYINALREEKRSNYIQSLAGISATRMNARFMSYFFNFNPEKGIPHDMNDIKNLLKTRDIIFCGALRYAPDQTSDATAVKLASFLKTSFINLTNVKGLYNKNPFENKDAKFIAKASIEEFAKIVFSIPSKPGMHAPVDHEAMRVIKKNKIKTYIIGKDTKQLDNLLKGKSFIGTTIE